MVCGRVGGEGIAPLPFLLLEKKRKQEGKEIFLCLCSNLVGVVLFSDKPGDSLHQPDPLATCLGPPTAPPQRHHILGEYPARVRGGEPSGNELVVAFIHLAAAAEVALALLRPPLSAFARSFAPISTTCRSLPAPGPQSSRA